MRKILYTSNQFPWPMDNGQKVVTFNDLKSLSEVFEIYVISFIDPIYLSRKDEYLKELKKRLPNIHFFDPIEHQILRGNLIKDKILPFAYGVFHKIPYIISRYRNPAYVEMTNKAFSERTYDILYIDHLNPSFILDTIAPEHLNRLTIIYRMGDAIHETLAGYSKELGINPTSVATRLDYSNSLSYEKKLWKRADFILPVTRRLGDLVADELPDLRSKIIYLPVTIELVEQAKQTKESNQRVLYVGTVHYPVNLMGLKWFLNQCWPLVLEKHPKAKVDIVGRGGKLLSPAHPSVYIHEHVDDPETYYQSAEVCIVPLFAGSGIRMKILDALNHGVPVVSTRTGFAGLELEEGRDIYVADTPAEFANQICDLLSSQEKRETLSKNGRYFLVTHHSSNCAKNAIEDLLSRLQDEREQQVTIPGNHHYG